VSATLRAKTDPLYNPICVRIKRHEKGNPRRAILARRQRSVSNNACPVAHARDLSLIRIAVSPRAYRAIKATLPAGSVVYPPERNDRGQYLLWLSEAEPNRHAALRRYGGSYSEAVIRMAKEAQD
jgi:hypothetical protein